ncbi:MAG: poly-beta-hydroxybutyrate polymerase, partial [Reyranella sp.]|nr:poly-beta-hydroxybutyrate polymerase [Reyranella sp.]
WDHVAPWRSTYKIHLLVDAPVTYVLASGGHNAGIVSEVGRSGLFHQVMTRHADDRHVDAETWLATAPHREGSWWPTYLGWLVDHSGEPIDPPPMGNIAAGYVPLCDAPGTYVLED